MSSIIYKLDINADKSMKLGGLNDIAGIRFVFKDIDATYSALKLLQENVPENFILKDEIDDYIQTPQASGYRSIHIVYIYKNPNNEIYNNLRIEVQLRTRIQHQWAMAVETAELITNTHLKTSQGGDDWLEFFRIISGLFALREKQPICEQYSKYDINQLLYKLHNANEQKAILKKLMAMKSTADAFKDSHLEHPICILSLKFTEKKYTIQSFPEEQSAVSVYQNLENTINPNEEAVVLVKVSDINALNKAYPSYFLDMNRFINTLKAYERIYNFAKRMEEISNGQVRIVWDPSTLQS